jgi:FMN-dependent NADH-azoreductase
MRSLLLVTSSLFGQGSKSRQVALDLVERLSRADPALAVTERALEAGAIPHLDFATVSAWQSPDAVGAAARIALSETLTREVERADTIVIAAPMYNFSIPSTLKAWIDHIARAGRTFRYTAEGPEGLLKGRKVYVVTGRGGIYTGTSPVKALDFQEPYLRAMLGFLGLTDVTFIHVEGLAMGEQAATDGLARARDALGAVAPLRVAA